MRNAKITYLLCCAALSANAFLLPSIPPAKSALFGPRLRTATPVVLLPLLGKCRVLRTLPIEQHYNNLTAAWHQASTSLHAQPEEQTLQAYLPVERLTSFGHDKSGVLGVSGGSS